MVLAMEYRLKDCLESIVDNRGKNPKYFDIEKYPVIDNFLIKNTLYPKIDNVTRYIDESTYNEFLRGYLEKNIPIMTLVGSGIGNVSLVPTKNVVIVQNTIGFKTKENLNSIFLYYWFLTKQVELYNLNRGSSQPSIKKTDIENMIINLPKLPLQKKIVKILFTIDLKIEINNKINDNLYEISRQLYKHWFIDFEFPNEEGKPYKSSKGKFVETELGEIPEEWTIKRLDEISINFDSKRKPLSSREREERKGNIPYYGATSIIDYVDKYLFDDVYVLMGEDGTVINSDNSPVLQYIWRKCWVNNHAHVLQGKGITTEHLMECLRNTDVSSIITGAVQLKINQANMNNLKYVRANDEVNKKFEKMLDEIYKKIRKTTEENETLEKLRKILLPKLMNGEIDLENIEI